MQVFGIVLGSIFLIFALYEIVERTWLADVDMRVLHVLHIIRGVGTSIVVTLLAVWYLLRTSPSIFSGDIAQSSLFAEDSPQIEDRIIHLGTWFIRMRWLACLVAGTLVFLITKVLMYLEEDTFWPLLSLVILLVGTNLLFSLLLKRRWFMPHLLEIQMASDLIVFTAMLHFSGGIENPLFLAYFFHIIIGGILLSKRKCFVIVALAFTLFAAMAFAEMGGLVQHYALLVFPHGIPESSELTTSEFSEDGHADAIEEDENIDPEQVPDGLGAVDDHESLTHAAHDPVYVSSLVILQFFLMSLTAFFITTIMDQLHSEEGRRRAIHQRLERVVEATGTGLAILNKSLDPVWMNHQISLWLNVSADDEAEASYRLKEWIGGDEGPEGETLRDGKVRIDTRQLQDADGNDRFVQVTISPLKNSTGEIYEVVQLTQDITEQKMLEQEMVQSEKMLALGIMAAGIAHEIGNPLASISTRLRVLEETQDAKKIKESVGLLQNQISRIANIVHGVSSIARPGEAEKKLCQINSPISEVLDMLRFHRRMSIVKINSRLAPGIPEINVARDHLVQVFLNLGLNAIEAMPKGGTLTIRSYIESDEVCISFQDTGVGIPEHLRSKVFDSFFSSKKSGMGMGLSIAKNIVKSQGGRIEVEDNPEGGTIFKVVLPIGTGGNRPSQTGERAFDGD